MAWIQPLNTPTPDSELRVSDASKQGPSKTHAYKAGSSGKANRGSSYGGNIAGASLEVSAFIWNIAPGEPLLEIL